MAESIGLSRQEFYAFKKRDGERFPVKKREGWDVNEVVKYLRETGRIGEKAGQGAVDYYVERARKMKADADRQELEVARIRGETLDAAEVYKSWSKQVSDIEAIMKKSNAALARKMEGKKTPEILLMLNEAWNKARNEMAK